LQACKRKSVELFRNISATQREIGPVFNSRQMCGNAQNLQRKSAKLRVASIAGLQSKTHSEYRRAGDLCGTHEIKQD
jgi:hypothetical protein